MPWVPFQRHFSPFLPIYFAFRIVNFRPTWAFASLAFPQLSSLAHWPGSPAAALPLAPPWPTADLPFTQEDICHYQLNHWPRIFLKFPKLLGLPLSLFPGNGEDSQFLSFGGELGSNSLWFWLLEGSCFLVLERHCTLQRACRSAVTLCQVQRGFFIIVPVS